jgi:hypothetical protein
MLASSSFCGDLDFSICLNLQTDNRGTLALSNYSLLKSLRSVVRR